MMKAEKLYFFVDSVSEGMAVLLVHASPCRPLISNWHEQRLVLPLDMLPRETAEGDYLRVSFERDTGRSERAREEIGRLMDGLGDNP